MPNIVTDYGAVADAEWSLAILTLSLAAPKALASTTNLWDSGDVGKSIAVPGAGAFGTTLLTTIAVFVDAKHVTLGDNASTAITALEALICWGTDNATSFANFKNAFQGQSVTLTIPAGAYYISQAIPLCDGITTLAFTGAGSATTTICGGVVQFGVQGLFQDNTHSARLESVNSGQSQVTCRTAAQTSLFTIGQAALITGLDLMGFGFPMNTHYFEWVTVAGKGTGTVSFNSSLANSYLSTWPLYNNGGAFEIDCGGPATLYAPRASWSCNHTYSGFRFVQQGPAGGPGKTITFTDVICESTNGIFPTQNETFSLNSCDFSKSTIEVDKMIKTMIINNTRVHNVDVQSSSIDLLQITGSTTLIDNVNGTAKNLQISGSAVVTNLSPSPSIFGRADSATVSGATVNGMTAGFAFGAPIDKGAADAGINNTAGVSMANGIITFPNNYKTNGPVPWAVPGTHCFWASENNWVEKPFQVLAVTQDALHTYVQTDQAGGFLPIPFNGTKIFVLPHPCPSATFRNVSSTDQRILSLNSATAGAPLYSEQSLTYTSGVAHGTAQPSFVMIGTLTMLVVTVTRAYGGVGALTFTIGVNWPVLNSVNNPTTTIFYNAVVNAKIAAARIITLAGVTGTQAGDSGLAVPDSTQTWFVGNAATSGPVFSADVSGTDPNVTVTIGAVLYQGFTNTPTPTPSSSLPSGYPNFNAITTTTLRHRNFPVPAGYPHAKTTLISPYGHRSNQRLGSTFRSGSPNAHRIGAGTKLPPPRRRK